MSMGYSESLVTDLTLGNITCKAEKIFSLSNLLFDLKPDSIGAELEEVLDRYQSNDQLQVASKISKYNKYSVNNGYQVSP